MIESTETAFFWASYIRGLRIPWNYSLKNEIPTPNSSLMPRLVCSRSKYGNENLCEWPRLLNNTDLREHRRITKLIQSRAQPLWMRPSWPELIQPRTRSGTALAISNSFLKVGSSLYYQQLVKICNGMYGHSSTPWETNHFLNIQWPFSRPKTRIFGKFHSPSGKILFAVLVSVAQVPENTLLEWNSSPLIILKSVAYRHTYPKSRLIHPWKTRYFPFLLFWRTI